MAAIWGPLTEGALRTSGRDDEHSLYSLSLVYKQFRVFEGEVQGGVLDGFDLFWDNVYYYFLLNK